MKILSFDVGIRNLAFCVLDENLTIYQWETIDLKQDMPKKMGIDELCHLLWDNLDNFPQISEVDKVVIENQPSLKNPKMKTVQILLLGYFTALQRTGITNIKKIDFFLPRNKLNIYQGDKKSEIEASITSKSKYTRTKNLSIAFTKEMIKDQEKWFNLINASKKKDDLADSFIQGACYIKRFTKP